MASPTTPFLIALLLLFLNIFIYIAFIPGLALYIFSTYSRQSFTDFFHLDIPRQRSPTPPLIPSTSTTSSSSERSHSRTPSSNTMQKTLLVIAHPDDECMFFGPSLIHLPGEKGVLCLSSGNADGLGKTRSIELVKSCKVLGISEENVTVLEHNDLQDGMQNHWDRSIIADIVVKHMEQHQYDTVCSFTLI